MAQDAEDLQNLLRANPFLVASINSPDALFCKLTGKIMSKTSSSAMKHITGKKYIQARGSINNIILIIKIMIITITIIKVLIVTTLILFLFVCLLLFVMMFS